MRQKVFTKLKYKIRSFRVNKQYKDRLFRFIFRNKVDLLDLYNAVNKTAYTNPDELIITTLEDVVYLGMKNDVGFLIGYHMNLYEHQSTWNPNMPLRGLLYFADMIRGYVEERDLDIYGTKKVALPVPRYVIFYNGTAEQPDKVELRLSDLFMKSENGSCALECRATMLNINYGHNQDIMMRCRRLADYAYFVQTVRSNLSQGYLLEDAVDLAADECIEKGILADILMKNRAEVKNLLLTVYNEKQHNKTLREEGREEGRREGIQAGSDRINQLNRRLLEDGREDEMRRATLDAEYQRELLREYGL